MEKICGIYKITSPNKRVYIGQSLNIMLRFSYYKRMSCTKQTKLYRSFLKHGVEKHVFDIIHECDRSELDDLEIYYIESCDSCNMKNGLNIRAGGSRGTHSEETKKKLSERAKGRKASEKTKQIMREAALKRPPMSDETKERHRISALGKNKGKKHTPETLKKMSIASTGRRHTDEFKEKLRIRSIGNKHCLGRKHSEETLFKIRAASRKRIVHPSVRSYDARGCRCDECKALKSENYKKKLQKKQEQLISRKA